jgi:hypothetical protein
VNQSFRSPSNTAASEHFYRDMGKLIEATNELLALLLPFGLTEMSG